jgi:hypothetical protein
MKRSLLLALAIVAVLAPPAGAESEFQRPYENGTGFQPRSAIDTCVLAALEERGIQPSNPCSDQVFLRRAHIDVLGLLPDPATVRRFLDDERPDKRARLIDDLLAHPDFADYWTLKWGDLLRIKAEFPIRLWPNGVQAYHRWIHDAILNERPYDEFARDLLTSSGSNFRVAPVNFYRAMQDRSADGMAAAVALTFMGTRFEKWPEERRKGMAAFFSRVKAKPTDEWKEEIILNDPAPAGPLEAVFPDGTKVTIPPDEDPRRVFADWLLKPGNPWFARSIANRVWSWLFGRGIVHEPDDLRPDNPPSNPALLDCLVKELVAADFDLKHLFRYILRSRTYQGSSIPRSKHPEAAALFAHYGVRRLDAEVLIDALCRLDGRGPEYVSIVPEPFTYLPDMRRTVQLSDGTITSPFLEMFGRPARDTGLESERSNEPTDAQRLYLLNSTEVQRRIEQSPWLRQLVNRARRDRLGIIIPIYMTVLARNPTRQELAIAAAYFGRDERRRQVRQAAVDLAWALVNSKEFLYRH